MKRPSVRPGVGKAPASASANRDKKVTSSKPAAKRANLSDSGKILASVTELATVRKTKQREAKASPARPRKTKQRIAAVAATATGRRIFARLSPEAARFRAYSRRRRAILASVIGSFTALILLMLASMYTPLLAVESIRITGTSRLKVGQLQSALKSQIGTPLPMVNSDKIGEALKSFPLIESFSITSRPPHSLVIRITERSPIAEVAVGGTSYLYDPAGVRIGQRKGSDSYPQIAINGDPANSAEYALAIDVLLALPASLLPRVYSIDAKTKDNVTMQLRGNAGQRIVWGDASRSALKSKVLAALIRNYKKSDRVTFDVSSPTAPVVRY
jgi:cell division protein FtsQ